MTGRKLTKADLPDVGDRRFWVVEHNPKSKTRPVTVSLREDTTTRSPARTTGRVGFSRLIGTDDAKAATIDEIAATAKALLERVGQIDDMVGEF